MAKTGVRQGAVALAQPRAHAKAHFKRNLSGGGKALSQLKYYFAVTAVEHSSAVGMERFIQPRRPFWVLWGTTSSAGASASASSASGRRRASSAAVRLASTSANVSQLVVDVRLLNGSSCYLTYKTTTGVPFATR
jgi:hypothetical protein